MENRRVIENSEKCLLAQCRMPIDCATSVGEAVDVIIKEAIKGGFIKFKYRNGVMAFCLAVHKSESLSDCKTLKIDDLNTSLAGLMNKNVESK